MDAIDVSGLTKTFGDVRAVDDLSFTVPFGKVTGFLGPNGAGKSTTLKMILGLVRPDRGAARLLDRPMTELPRFGDVGAVLDTQQFHPKRSGKAHLEVLALAVGATPDRVQRVLEMVELDRHARRKVGTYSLGMRQRLGLAAALLGDPKVLVLDEPGNGLDPAGIVWLRAFLKRFADDGGAVLVSSHQLAEISAVAHDVVVIDRGHLVTHSPMRDLLQRAGGEERKLEDVFFELLAKEGSAR